MVTRTVDVWEDCGKPETLLATNRYLLRTSGGQATEAENSIIIPPVYIASSASVSNSVVGPYVSIAAKATVENSIVRDSIIDQEAHIQDAILRQSLVGNHAWVKGNPRSVDIGDHSRVDWG